MKQITFFLLAVTLFAACKKQCVCGGYTVEHNPCECVIFKGKIGNDFDSALDSLKRYYEPEFNIKFERGFYSGKGYFVEKERINVDFPYDNRDFFRIYFTDSVITYGWLIVGDILDEKGNYYRYTTGLKD